MNTQLSNKRRQCSGFGMIAVFSTAIIVTTNQLIHVDAFAITKKSPSPSKTSSTSTAQRSSISSVASFPPPPSSPWELLGLQQQPSSQQSGRRKQEQEQQNPSSWITTILSQMMDSVVASPLPRRLSIADEEYERRKQEWASRYTSVHSLRETFGSNRNKLWGDLDAETTRRLYKTLLPRAIMELYDSLGGNVHPEDLAPLAYKARVAAKLYARERCEVIPRMGAMAIDGFRQLKRYGKFQPKGMSYDQVWEKYRTAVIEEIEDELSTLDEEEALDDSITAKICLKIMERSCSTNEGIDKLILSDDYEQDQQHEIIHSISKQLARDVRELLSHPSTSGGKKTFCDYYPMIMSNPALKPLKKSLAAFA